jgi:chromosome segregation ATPase
MAAYLSARGVPDDKCDMFRLGPGSLHRWAKAVEAALVSRLSTFLVHDQHDLQILREITRQSGVKMPPVIVCRLDAPPHNLPPQLLPPTMLTVLHVLSCNDRSAETAVMNMLVDVVRTT